MQGAVRFCCATELGFFEDIGAKEVILLLLTNLSYGFMYDIANYMAY